MADEAGCQTPLTGMPGDRSQLFSDPGARHPGLLDFLRTPRPGAGPSTRARRNAVRRRTLSRTNLESPVRFIPTRVHGVLDYIVSALVALLPFVFGSGGALRWPFFALGAFGAGYSLLTDYELGAVRLIPVRTHLLLDGMFILLLLALAAMTPVPNLRWAAVILGAGAGLVALLTRRAPAA